jgi:hypothetical protein
VVAGALWIGGSIGVVLSGAFVYWEIGRFATPQVPTTLFDERKLFIAYTGGLFVGIALSIPFGLFLTSLSGSSVLLALVGLGLLLSGLEGAQWAVLRSQYFGHGEAGPFYALGMRLGVAAILVLTLVTLYVGGMGVNVAGFAAVLVESVAMVALVGAGALLSIRLRRIREAPSGGPLSSAVVTGAGLFFLGLGGAYGPAYGSGVAVVVLAVAIRTYLRLRDPVLAAVAPPRPAESAEAQGTTAFGRIDR